MRVENLRTICKHCNPLETTVPLTISNDLLEEKVVPWPNIEMSIHQSSYKGTSRVPSIRTRVTILRQSAYYCGHLQNSRHAPDQ
jgi:hypothetical protein